MKSYSSGYSDMEELKLILIVGPTASGKTAASIYAAIFGALAFAFAVYRRRK